MSTYIVDVPMQPARWVAAIPLALAATIGIFAFMENLVFTVIEEPEETSTVLIDPPIYEETLIETQREIEKPKKPEVQEAPELPEESNTEPGGGDLTLTYQGPNPSEIGGGVNLSFSGMPLPQVRVQPRYPNRALERGIEGYVDVRFDITKIGTTQNIVVIHANPEGTFDRAAVAAVKRWKYQPQMEEGEAVEYKGMTQRIAFEMEK